jgi:hypothetical protein
LFYIVELVIVTIEIEGLEGMWRGKIGRKVSGYDTAAVRLRTKEERVAGSGCG